MRNLLLFLLLLTACARVTPARAQFDAPATTSLAHQPPGFLMAAASDPAPAANTLADAPTAATPPDAGTAAALRIRTPPKRCLIYWVQVPCEERRRWRTDFAWGMAVGGAVGVAAGLAYPSSTGIFEPAPVFLGGMGALAGGIYGGTAVYLVRYVLTH